MTSETDPSDPNREARFIRSVLAASEDCIKILDLDGALVFMSEGGQKVMEVDDFEQLRGCHWPDIWTGGGAAHAKAALAAARAGRSYRFQEMANTARGNPRHWDVQVTPIFGPDGRPESILSVSRDVTALKESEERYKLLAAELHHRIKNMLALTQSVTAQTLRAGGEALAPYRARIDERLVALARAQDMLFQAESAEAQLDALVRSVLTPHDLETRIVIDGPPVRLRDRAATAMTLAIHELGSNAAKYGALSRAEGRVALSWSYGDDVFHMEWRETGGPIVAAPTRRGFGSQLIEKTLSVQLRGKAVADYRPEGVVFRLEAPLDALLARE
ncbi:HWE histidine kinase domain-containing protein [Methylopila henanensis]|uniref:Blue-light-activated histidine kinase n=1 Tax=Methylopila henanensis TaxID=873516 RepID=A0ABW4K9W8_9HYPH